MTSEHKPYQFIDLTIAEHELDQQLDEQQNPPTLTVKIATSKFWRGYYAREMAFHRTQAEAVVALIKRQLGIIGEPEDWSVIEAHPLWDLVAKRQDRSLHCVARVQHFETLLGRMNSTLQRQQHRDKPRAEK